MMKALGYEEDSKIAEMISTDDAVQNHLAQTFEKSIGVVTQRDALLYVGNRLAPGQVEDYRLKKAEAAIDRNFLPHIGRNSEERREKAAYLAEVGCRVIELKLGMRQPDDKDHYANKRLKLAGFPVGRTFQDLVQEPHS